MRRPTRTPFHHSDLGGPFVAFAPGFRECGEDLRVRGGFGHPLFYPTRHQRSSMLIDALRHRRLYAGPTSTVVNQRPRAGG